MAACAIAIDGQRLPVPQEQLATVASWTDRDVRIGIRPEHLTLGDLPAEVPTLTASVRLVEHLGSELLVHLDIAGTTLVARVPVQTAVRAGETRRVGVNVRATHLFDAAGDQPRITAPTTA